jgi:hypothetical protein
MKDVFVIIQIHQLVNKLEIQNVTEEHCTKIGLIVGKKINVNGKQSNLKRINILVYLMQW